MEDSKNAEQEEVEGLQDEMEDVRFGSQMSDEG